MSSEPAAPTAAGATQATPGPGPRPEPDQAAGHDVVDGLTRVLARACRRLADDGRTQEASRFAADGWLLLRGAYPKQTARMDGLMHHIARQEQRFEAADRLDTTDPC